MRSDQGRYRELTRRDLPIDTFGSLSARRPRPLFLASGPAARRRELDRLALARAGKPRHNASARKAAAAAMAVPCGGRPSGRGGWPPALIAGGLTSHGSVRLALTLFESVAGAGRSEHAIPDHHRDAEAGVGLFEMMQVVVPAQATTVITPRLTVMEPVVRQIVEHVARGEAGMEAPAIVTERQHEQQHEREIERQARARREDQTQLVVRPLVMHAVDQKVRALRERARPLKVKYGSVQPILGEGPKREPGQR